MDSETKHLKPGDVIWVKAIVAENIGATIKTNWPIKILRDQGESETIDRSDNVHFSAIATPTPPQDGREGEDEPVLQDGPLTVILRDTIERIYEVARAEHGATRPAPAAQPSAPTVQREWLPIETAPKDGVLIQCWHIGCAAPISVRWNSEGFGYPEQRLYWVEASYGQAWPEEAFSHWRPLPAPPGTTSPVAGDAAAIGEAICEELRDRKGFDPDSLDREVFEEFRLSLGNAALKAIYAEQEIA